MLRRCAWLVLIAALAAACGPLPRPFQPEYKEGASMAALGDRAQLRVMPIENDRPGDPYDAAAALADALRDFGIAASANSQVAERILVGRAIARPIAADRDAITILWELQETGGERLALIPQNAELPRGLWRDGHPAAVRSVMAEAAPDLAALYRDNLEAETEPAAGPPPTDTPRLFLVPLENVPGDGAHSITLALERELEAAAYPLAEDMGDDDLLILCDIALAPAGNRLDHVSITWFVVQASTGEELGRIDQQSHIPKGSVDEAWGDAAIMVARGAAQGIIELINKTRGT